MNFSWRAELVPHFVFLQVIWAIGLGGAIGVLYRNPWGQWMLQLFCWMLIALAVNALFVWGMWNAATEPATAIWMIRSDQTSMVNVPVSQIFTCPRPPVTSPSTK